jgi:hypothetical protein
MLKVLIFYLFIYSLNQQSEFTFYKLMLWLLQCLDGESSSGEWQTNFVTWVHERTIPTELPPLDSEVSANFCI